jgi:hypothetical protein
VLDLPLLLNVLEEPPKLLPDFATSLSLEADEPAIPGCGVEEVDPAADSGREELLVAPLVAKKVLLTETDLKLFGLTLDDVRAWLLESDLPLGSALDASVSEPPLTLTSAEFTSSSTMSAICLFSISSVTPFEVPTEESPWCASDVVAAA